MKKDARDNAEELLAIFDSIQRTPEEWMAMSLADVKQEFTEEGFEYSLKLKISLHKFYSFLTRRKLNVAKSKREAITMKYFANGAQSDFNLPSAKEALMTYLSNISSERRQVLTANFRNFENFSEEDYKTTLDDLKYLDEKKKENES